MLPPTPLHRPFSAFRDPPRWITRPGVILGLALGSAVFLTAAVYVFGQVLAAQTTGTVAVDNPAYPGDGFCNNPAAQEAMPEGHRVTGCDEPKTVQRDASAIVEEAVVQIVGLVFFGWLFMWLVGAGALHVAAWIARGRGTAAESFAIASWSGAASALASIPSLVVLTLAIRSSDVELSDPERARQTLEAAIAPVEPLLLVLALLGTTWQAVVWYAGLRELHDLDASRAAFIAVVFWLTLLLGSL